MCRSKPFSSGRRSFAVKTSFSVEQGRSYFCFFCMPGTTGKVASSTILLMSGVMKIYIGACL